MQVEQELDRLRYPVGRFEPPPQATEAGRQAWLEDFAATPARLRAAVAGLSDAQLDTPYRPGGWTVRQVVHHLPDSHMNLYIRLRMALTEDEPTIKPYREEKWAELPDARTEPVEPSLALLECLHHRLAILMRTLAPADWQRTFRHPERGTVSLEDNLAMYAWHGRHHVAHITGLRERMGWR
jgi:hypothetical protein